METKKKHKIVYVHYGHDIFQPEKLPVKDCSLAEKGTKPEGLWASPTNARCGWKEWCKIEHFHPERLESSFCFSLAESARVLHINSLDDAVPFFIFKERFRSLYFWDLNLSEIYRRYDAIELHIANDYVRFRGNNVFSKWDVDSICIWNPDIVVPIPALSEKSA